MNKEEEILNRVITIVTSSFNVFIEQDKELYANRDTNTVTNRRGVLLMMLSNKLRRMTDG